MIAVPKGKLITLNAFIKKLEIFHNSKLKGHLRVLEKKNSKHTQEELKAVTK